MKRKVLYIITKSDVGGAQKYVADLAEHLDPAKFEARILYGGRELKWLANRTMPWLLFANDFFAIIELVRVFRRERPDIIHLNSSKAGVIGSFAAGIYTLTCRLSLVACPNVIFTAHGWAFNPTNHYPPFVRWAYRMLHRVAARFQDTIVNVSEYDRGLALRYRIAPPKKLVTIYNGIDQNIPFLTKEKARKEILSRLTTYDIRHTTDALWVGSIGRLTKEKDYATLIRAAREFPEAYFFIIGEGPELKDLRRMTHDLRLAERIFFVPPQGGDARLLKAFDVFTLSSIKEGLPYSLLEALAAGVPAVVTDVGGMPEVTRRSPSVKTVPPRSAAALAAKIKNALGQSTNKGPSVPFSLTAMVTAIAALYVTKPTEGRQATS